MKKELTPDEEKLVARVEERRSQAKQYKRQRELEMRLELMYYMGEQFAYINNNGELCRPTTIDVEKLKKKDNKILFAQNKTTPTCRTVVSRLTQRKPTMYCQAWDTTEKAKNIARMGSDCLKYYRTRKGMEYVDKSIAWWTTICGVAYKRVMPTQDGMDVEVDHLTPFEVLTPPGCKLVPKMPWIFVEKMADRTDTQTRFNVELDNGTETTSFISDESNSLITGEPVGDQVVLKEYYERPNKKNPKGLHVIICQGQLLKNEEFPEWEDDTNYRIVEYHYNPPLISHWTKGLVGDCINVQKKLNAASSNWMTNAQMTNAHKLIVHPNSPMSEQLADNTPEVIPYDTNKWGVPNWLSPPPPDFNMRELVQELHASFDEQSGVHRTSRGDEPTKRMPAVAMQMMTEMDMDKFSPIFDSFEESDRQAGYCIIRALQTFTTQVPYMAGGSDSQLEVQDFLSDDFADMEVVLERRSSIPESKAGQTATILELQQYGFFEDADPLTKMQLLQGIDQGWSKKIIEDSTATMQYAEHENRQIRNGENPPVSEYQNDELHMAVHSRLFDTSEYLQIVHTEEEAFALQHMEDHKASMERKAMRMAEQQAMIQPPTGQPGQPVADMGVAPPAMTPEEEAMAMMAEAQPPMV